MNIYTERLRGVFRNAFPDVAVEQIDSMSMASNSKWDSLACLTLLTLIQEEFDVEIPVQDMELMASFELIANYLQEKGNDVR
jgi:acyl carrier protein